MEKMRFKAHESFFIRKGWLHKGLKNILLDPYIFSEDTVKSTDALGIGNNMVKSLRYWLQAVGLTIENKTGKRKQEITDLGSLILKEDPYMEEIGTLDIIHYRLATNKEEATSWYFFFNEFESIEFTKDDFVSQLKKFIKIRGKEVAERSLEDDYNCILNTYISRIKIKEGNINPEENIDCPLGELNLLSVHDKKEKIYKRNFIRKKDINPFIALAIILDSKNKNDKEIKISNIHKGNSSLGKVFNLDISNLLELLYDIENLGYIKVVRTAGLDIIRIEKDISFIECLKNYYKTLAR